MKSSLIKIENLPSNMTYKYTIRLKPIGLLIFGFAFGVLCYLVTSPVSELGLFIAILCIFLFMMLPDRILLQFGTQYLLLFSKETVGEVRILYYDEIVSYSYVSSASNDMLTFNLIDGNSYSIEVFGKRKLLKILAEVLPFKKV